MKPFAIFAAIVLASCATHANDGVEISIANLDHGSYQERERATANLAKAGEAALPALLEISRTGSEESKWRAYSVIRQIVDDDEELLNKTIAQAKEGSLPWLASNLTPVPTVVQPPPTYAPSTIITTISLPVSGAWTSGPIVTEKPYSISAESFRIETLKAIRLDLLPAP